jgi:hypothetical protein
MWEENVPKKGKEELAMCAPRAEVRLYCLREYVEK